MTTGGMISGRCINPFRIDLPTNSRRASTWATRMPKGRLTSVAQVETLMERRTAVHSSGLRRSHSIYSREPPQFTRTGASTVNPCSSNRSAAARVRRNSRKAPASALVAAAVSAAG